jgi:hypothetical protein
MLSIFTEHSSINFKEFEAFERDFLKSSLARSKVGTVLNSAETLAVNTSVAFMVGSVKKCKSRMTGGLYTQALAGSTVVPVVYVTLFVSGLH